MRIRAQKLSSSSLAFLIVFALRLDTIRTMADTSVESTGGAYLRNVVSELQNMNEVYSPTYLQQGNYQFLDRRTATKHDRDLIPAGNALRYRKVPLHPLLVQGAKQTSTALAYTTAELAAMYLKALQQGAPSNLGNFLAALSNGQSPKIVNAPMERPQPIPQTIPQPIQLPLDSQPQQYAYFFYPLNSFSHKLPENYIFQPLPTMTPPMQPVDDTKKDMTNPLFLMISSLIGMALIFIIGILLYPRFVSFPRFTSKGIHDEFLQLTRIVADAIDGWNSVNRYKPVAQPSKPKWPMVRSTKKRRS